MSQDNDWRLMGQEQYLMGAKLKWAVYRQPKPSWDHEHCEFCFRKILEGDQPDSLQEAYQTEDGSHWICSTCFVDFKQRFAWVVTS